MPRSSSFDSHKADIPVPGVAIPTANQELAIWDSTRVPVGADQVDPTVAADANTGTCPHVKGILVFVIPTAQAVVVKLYWKAGGVWTVMNNTGTGETVAAAARYAKVLPCGGTDTKVTITAGATPPTTLLSSARLRDNADPITIP